MVLAIIIVGFGLLLGGMAQRWKRRAGVVWAIVGVVIVAVAGRVFDRSISTRYTDAELVSAQTRLKIAVVGYGAPMAAVALLLFSLPARRKPEPDPPPWEKRLERKCPDCAEMILAEARVCRFCGRQVRPILEPEDMPTLPAGPPTPPPDPPALS
jgi:hypothetical protein